MSCFSQIVMRVFRVELLEGAEPMGACGKNANQPSAGVGITGDRLE